MAEVADLRGARVVVGGGPTDELELLCQLTIAAVDRAGGRAGDQCARYGALDARLPRDRSLVDAGWGYLARPDRDLDGRADPPATLTDLARDDAAQGLTWFTPTAFSDAEVAVAPAGGIRTVADLPRAPGATLCAPPEADVAAVLGPSAPPVAVRRLDAAAVAAGTARGACTAGVLPGTSGRIPALGLVPLTGGPVAPPGTTGAAPVVRSDVAARAPGLDRVLGALTARLDADTMRALNREVTQDGRDPRDVARDWMQAVFGDR